MSAPTTPDDPGGDGSQVESFLGRRRWGLTHYLWISLAVTIALGFVPRGVNKTLQSNTNNAEDWLPASYAESADLVWFREHFANEAFVLISWDGCQLRDEQQLADLRDALADVRDKEGWAWFPRIRSGPETIRELTEGAAGLSSSQAIRRLEGALVGPPEIGADGQPLGDGTRTTCLLAFLNDRLTTNNIVMRRAVERVRDTAVEVVGVPQQALHLGGPPVDSITIDIEGEKTLLSLAWLSGLVGLVLAYACFRSVVLTPMVFWTAGASAGMSLALVYWFGLFERLLTGLQDPRLGKADAILMSMPAVVYVLALSGAIHLVNYYRDERLSHGVWGAAERAAKVAWGPCLLAAFTTAVGLGSLGSSDILPIQKFGIFSAIGVMVAFALLFTIMPVFLHRFPPGERVIEERVARLKRRSGREWYAPLARFTTERYGLAAGVCLLAMAAIGYGVTKTTTSVTLLGLLDESCDLIQDYEWFENHLGNLVPMEVIVALEPDQLRSPDEPAIDPRAAQPRYRMTMYERSQLAKSLQAQVESLDEVSRALSVATFAPAPQDSGSSAAMQRGWRYTVSQKLEQSRDELNEHLVSEQVDGETTGRELWRVSARVQALGDIDYGQFVSQLRVQVDPVLATYAQRDKLLSEWSSSGKERVCLLTGSRDAQVAVQETRLAELLAESDGLRMVTDYSLEGHLARSQAERSALLERLKRDFAIVELQEGLATEFGDLQATFLAPAEPPGQRPKATEAVATYTGVVPLVYKTQRELLASLRESIGWATVLIGGVMVVVLRNPLAGVASMVPNVFPIVVVFGALGWLGIPVDIGIMMTASVALGVAVDDTLHFVTWFGRGVREHGLDRRSAVLLAYERCATAMTQTTLIGGLGLAVFAVSTFTPTQQFGCLMITILAVALVGDLVLLPALLCGPMGRFFAPGAPARPVEVGPGTPLSALRAAPRSPEEPPRDDPDSVPPAADPPSDEATEATEPVLRIDGPMSPQNADLLARLRRLRRQSSG